MSRTTVYDITDRKQLELALKASEAMLEDILNNAIAAVGSFRILADGEWRINYRSPTYTQVFGYTPAELAVADSAFWLSRIHPEDLEAVIQP